MAQVLPYLTSFWLMGKPTWSKWKNNYDAAQLQVLTSSWNFKWGKSIQRIQTYAFRKIWTQFDKFWGPGQAHMGQMGKWPWKCTTTGLDNSTDFRMEKIRQAITEIRVPQMKIEQICFIFHSHRLKSYVSRAQGVSAMESAFEHELTAVEQHLLKS